MCFPAAEVRSRNRSGQREKAGMLLRLLPVNQSQGTAATIRLEAKDVLFQRLVC